MSIHTVLKIRLQTFLISVKIIFCCISLLIFNYTIITKHRTCCAENEAYIEWLHYSNQENIQIKLSLFTSL